MLIPIQKVKDILETHSIQVKGILHVGAHQCEEKFDYNTVLNISDDKIIWVDANAKLVEEMKEQGIPHIYSAVLHDKEEYVTFNITNNGQSSSILELGTHKHHHPHVYVTETRTVRTQTLDQFVLEHSIDLANYNVWNFDIQGSEYDVLRGSKHLLQYADCIYTEVNTEEVYKGCGKIEQLDELLAEYGLTRVMTNMTEYRWGDAVYVRINK